MIALNLTSLALLLFALAFLVTAGSLAVLHFVETRETRRRVESARAARQKWEAHRGLTGPVTLTLTSSAETKDAEADGPDNLDAMRRTVLAWAAEHARRSA